jgi:hypothetical protein
MFGLFKKKKLDFKNEVSLMKAIFSRLEGFGEIKKQLDEGIITGISLPYDTWWPNYVKFSLNNELLNKYEDKLRPTFTIMGITVFDSKSSVTTEIQIRIWCGILTGFESLNSRLYNPEIETINTSGYWIKYSDQSDFEIIKDNLTKEDVKLVNPSEVYEVELENRKYYHLIDLEDGDFIGMGTDKKIYKITPLPPSLQKPNLQITLVPLCLQVFKNLISK